MKSLQQSLTARLAVYFLLLALSLVGMIGWLAYALSRDNLSKIVARQIEAVWFLQQDVLQAWLNEQQHDLEALAASPYISNQVDQLLRAPEKGAQQQAAQRTLMQELTPQLQLRPEFTEFLILERQTGQSRFSTKSVNSENLFLPEQFLAQINSPTNKQRIYLFRPDGSSQLTLATPLTGGVTNSTPPALLVTQVNLTSLKELLKNRYGLQGTVTTHLLDTNGQSLIAENNSPPISSFGSQQAWQRQRGVSLYSNQVQVPVIGAYGWLEALNLVLLVELPQTEAFAPSRQMAFRVLLLGLSVALVLTALMWRVARQMARPILAIHETALLVTQGERSAQAPVLTTDEVGALAQSFNTMVAKLREVELGLRSEIAERVAVEERFAKLFFASPIAIAIERISDRVILEANDEFVRLTRRSREELIGKQGEQLGFALNSQLREQFYRDIQTQGRVRDLEFTAGLEPQQYTLLCSAERIVFQGADCVIATFQDISERKRAEMRFAKVFHESPVPMALMRLRDQTYLTANAEFLRLTRLTPAEVPGKTHQQIGFELDAPTRQQFFNALLTQDSLRDYELTISFRGHKREILVSSEKILFNGEACLLGSFQNITERKQAEDRFTKAFHANPVSMTIFSLRTKRIIEVNSRTLELTGLSREEMLGRTVHELGIVVASPSWQTFNEALRTASQFKDLEITVHYRSTEYTLLACAETIVFNDEACLLWSQQDISALKQAEERFSKAFLANPLPMSIARWRDGKIIEVNDSSLRLMGFSRAEMIGQTALELGFYVDPAQRQEIYEQLCQSGTVRDYEARQRYKDQTREHTALLSVETITLKGERCTLWTMQDITERKRAEELLHDSQARLRMALEAGSLGVWEHDIVRNIVYLDARSQLHYDLPPMVTFEEITQRIHPEDRELLTEDFSRTLNPRQNSDKHTMDYRVLLPNGNLRWLRIEAEVQFAGSSEARYPVSSIGTSQDITARKLTEAALRASEERQRIALEATQLGIWEHNLRDGSVRLDEHSQEHFGILNATTTLSELQQRFHPDDVPMIQETLWAAYDPVISDGNYALEYRVKHSYDHWRWLAVRGRVHFEGTGPHRRAVQVVGSSLDITERKHAAERFYKAFHANPTAMSIVRARDRVVLEINDAFLKLAGWERAEIVGDRLANHSFDMDTALREEIYEQIAHSGSLHNLEMSVRFNTGQKFVITSAEAITLNGEACVLWSNQDITERQQAEERFIKAFDANPNPMALIALPVQTYVQVNQAWLDATGLTKAEVIGKSGLELSRWLKPESRQEFYERLAALGHVHDFEAEVRDQNQERRIYLLSGDIIQINGQPHLLTSSNDITARKQAEAAIQTSEARFRALTESSPAVILIFDKTGFSYVNPAAEKLFGYTQEEFKHLTLRDLLPPTAHFSIQQRFVAQQQGEAVSARHEVIVITKSGAQRWVDYSACVIELDGQSQILVTGFDVTKRKRAEAAIQTSEARFRTLAESSQAAILIFNDKRYLYSNPAASELFGFTPREFRRLGLRDVLHPESHAVLEQRQPLRHADAPVAQRNEAQIVTKSGEARWIDYSVGITEIEGVTRYIITALDITQRRLMAAALQASEARFRTLAESSQAAILIADEERYVYASPAAEQLFGYTSAEFAQFQAAELMKTDWHPTIFKRRPTGTLGEPATPHGEVKITKKDGTPRWISYSVGFTQLEGRPCRIITAFDITQRKQAEEERRISQEQLRNLAARLQAAREDERASMAREIHDEFGQALTGMKMDLKGIENQLPPEAAALRQRFQSLYELINTTVRNVRKLATTLRPGVLDDFGLVAAIEWQAREFETRTGITCHFREIPEDVPLEKEQATALFRIFQETLTNVARHAAATRVEVRLFMDDTNLCLQVQDNGKGIKSDEIKHTRSLGLIGMRERALLLGGTFSINGNQGQGTTVTVQIPSTLTTGG